MKDSLAPEPFHLIAEAVAQLPKPKKGEILTGRITCPACKGTMRYRVVAARDSRAACTDPRCGLQFRS